MCTLQIFENNLEELFQMNYVAAMHRVESICIGP